jgi:hypothetical protein
MEEAFVRNLKTGQLVINVPLQFVRIPHAGEGVQLGNVVWTVNNVIHAWRSPNDPLCEIRVMPPTRDEKPPLEHSVHE